MVYNLLFEIIGLIAGSLTSFAFLPQVFKVNKTRSANDFAWGWLFMTIFGLSLWLVYGLMINSPALILANAFSFFCVLYIILIKMQHKAKS